MEGGLSSMHEGEPALLVEELDSSKPIFHWPQEEVKGYGYHVSSGSMDGVMTGLHNKGNVEEDLDRNQFYMV